MKTQHIKFSGIQQAVLWGKSAALNSLSEKKNGFESINSAFHLRKREKEEKMKVKLKKRKNIYTDYIRNQ